MKKATIAVYTLLFLLIFLPIAYLFVPLLLPNFRVVDLRTLSDYFVFSLDKRAYTIFLHTVLRSLSVSIICGAVGLALAILLEFTDIAFKRALMFLLLIPLLIPSYLFTFSWMGFLGKRGTFAQFVFPNMPIDIYNPFTLVIFLSLSLFPISMIIISLGMKNIDRNLIDAGRLGNKKKVLSKLIIPLVKPHILISCFFVFMLAFSEYVVPSFLRLDSYSGEIFSQLAVFYNVKRAIVYSIPATVMAFIALIILFYSRSSFAAISGFSRKKEEFILLSSRAKVLSYFLIAVLLIFSVVVPAIMLFLESEMAFEAIAISTNSILNTLLLSIVSSVLITSLGFIVYHYIRSSNLLITLIAFPLAISSPVIGISLINLYNLTPVYGTIAMPMLGYIMKFLPFSVFIFMAFSPQISKSLEEAARMGKASGLKILYKIFLPLTKGAFFTSFIFILIFCIGEVGVTQMVVPAGFQTLAMRIEALMHYGNYPYAMTLSISMLTLIFLFYSIYLLVYRNYERA